jgi:hypothetical protein
VAHRIGKVNATFHVFDFGSQDGMPLNADHSSKDHKSETNGNIRHLNLANKLYVSFLNRTDDF